MASSSIDELDDELSRKYYTFSCKRILGSRVYYYKKDTKREFFLENELKLPRCFKLLSKYLQDSSARPCILVFRQSYQLLFAASTGSG